MNLKLILFFCCLAIGAMAQNDSLSLNQAIQRALAKNFDATIARAQIEINEKNNTWSEAGLFPTVVLQVGQSNVVQDNRNNPFTFTPGVILSQQVNPTLQANFNLFSGFQVKVNKQRLEQLEEQSRGNADLVMENIIRDVVKTYFQALLQRARRDFYGEVLTYSSRRLRYNEIKNQYGGNNSLELLQLKNQYLTDSTNWLMQNISYENSLRNLLLLMNEVDENGFGNLPLLTDSLEMLLPDWDAETILQKALADNQNLVNQNIAIELQQTNIEFQRSFLYPTLQFQLGVSPTWGRFEQLSGGNPNQPNSLNTQSLAYTGNFSLRYNLYNNWKAKRAVEVAKMQATIAEYSLQKLQNQVRVNLRNSLDLYAIRRNLLNVSEENAKYAQKAFMLAQSRFDAGSINSVELQVIQNNYLNTQLTHLENRFNLWDVFIDIYQLSGQLKVQYGE